MIQLQRAWSLKRSLVLFFAILTASQMLLGWLIWQNSARLAVGGPVYRDIQASQDLVADILPPPAYLVETHLLAHELENSADVRRLKRLAVGIDQFYQRLSYWHASKLPGSVLEPMFTLAEPNANAYLKVLNTEYLPALKQGDRERVGQVLAKLDRLFADHRAGIEAEVAAARAYQEQREAEVEVQLRQGRRALLGLSIASILLLIAAACLAWYRLDRILGGEPIKAQAVLKTMATGDLQSQVAVRGGDRDSVLSSVAQMRQQLIRVLQGIHQDGQALEKHAGEIAVSTEHIQQQSSNMASSISNIQQALEQIQFGVMHTRDSANASSRLAEAAKQRTRRGVELALTVSKEMHEIAALLKLVEDIAYQTNMLSLNATIEAARAGQHGRGFGVVANEVRKLAQRSQLAANQVGEITARIQPLADAAGSVFSELDGAIADVALRSSEVAQATELQAAGTNHITGAIASFAAAAQTDSATAEELANMAEEMSSLAETLREQIAYFRLPQESDQNPT